MPGAPGPYSVAEAIEAYFKRRGQKGSDPSLDERRAEMHIVSKIGAVPVDALTTAMLDAWLASMVKGKTPDKIRASRSSASRQGAKGWHIGRDSELSIARSNVAIRTANDQGSA